MTKEEALHVLILTNNWYKDKTTDPITESTSFEDLIQAIDIAINLLSQPSFPSNLDEAALKAYPKMPRLSEPHGIIPADNKTHYLGDANEENRIAFKAGAQWRDAQIPKLPNNLIEAAEEFYPDFSDNIASKAAVDSMRDAFKAGAEWMARQGVSFKVNVEEVPKGHWYAGLHLGGCAEEEENALKSINAKDGEEVIVQIRKE